MAEVRKTPNVLKLGRLAGVLLIALGTTGCFITGEPMPEITMKDLPASPKQPAKSGWDHLAEGAPRAAIAAFSGALSNDPNDKHQRLGLAEAYRRAGAHALAEKEYAQLLNSETYRIDAQIGIGFIKLASFDMSEAYDMFSSAVEEDAAAWRAWLGLAQLRDSGADWEGADEAYAQALENTDDRALVLNNHGVSMLARGDVEKAIALLNMALAIKPGSERVQTNLDLAMVVDEDGEIRSQTQHDIDNKEKARKLNNMGYVAMLRGDLNAADTLLEEASDAHPSFYATAYKNQNTLKAIKSRTAD